MIKNISDLNLPVDATKQITIIFQQILNCKKKMITLGAPFANAKNFEMVEWLLVAMGLYDTKYHDWLRMD